MAKANYWHFSSDYYCRSLNTLEIGLNQITAYKSWRNHDPGRGNPIDMRYKAMPILTKEDMRKFGPDKFSPADLNINDAIERGEISFVETSGTTGDQVINIWNQSWWDASEKSSWKLNSDAIRLATGNHREAILVNPLNVGIVSDKVDLSLEQRHLARFLYLNEKTDPLSWNNAHMDRMIEELEIFQPVILEANPSLLARLCRYITVNRKQVFQPGMIVLTYECPTIIHYRQIKDVFHVPVVSSYGTTETGYVFMQCEEGNYHQNVDFCRVDFQPFQEEHGGPDLGRILVTTFNNPWYYMIRFYVGDIVRLQESNSCPCGRNSGMILSSLEGRWDNVTLTISGRLVSLGELDRNLSVIKDIEEYQLIQLAQGVYEIHLVSQQENKKDLNSEVYTVLQNLYGQESQITIYYEKDIAPGPSGKYVLARALFPIDINDFLE